MAKAGIPRISIIVATVVISLLGLTASWYLAIYLPGENARLADAERQREYQESLEEREALTRKYSSECDKEEKALIESFKSEEALNYFVNVSYPEVAGKAYDYGERVEECVARKLGL